VELFDYLTPEWRSVLADLKETINTIDSQLNGITINPKREFIFRALERSISSTRVVIIGQDPYPNPEYAMGWAFSVPKGVRPLPGSLRNIAKEISTDLDFPDFKPSDGDLTPWVEQGVVLLNRNLTTVSGKSLGHRNVDWIQITNRIVNRFLQESTLFILWGQKAQELSPLIPSQNRIEGVHPSPLSASRGFFGSRPFSRANSWLHERGYEPLDWRF
jgi:uracil-DNA glycosylase